MKPKTQAFRRSKSLTDLDTKSQQFRSNLAAEKTAKNNANETEPKQKRQIYKIVPSTIHVHLDHSTHYSRGNRMAVTSAGNKCVYKWFEKRRNRRADGTEYLFCDGSFKYAPSRVHQVYRIFGLMLLEDGSYAAYPFVTALLHGKDEEIYKKLFIQVRDRLKTCEKQVRWKGALMDCETAAVKSFHKILTKEFGVQPFMCAFHVKSALNKYVSQIGLQEEYRQFESIQTCIRMIGALQFLDPDLYEQADSVILATIDEEVYDPVLNDQMHKVYSYYKKQWLSLDKSLGFKFFSLFNMHKNGPRTNNIAESYHGKLRAFFSRKSRLGVWIADFLRCSNREINNCEELIAGIYTGSQHNAVTKGINDKIMAAKEKLRDVIGDTTANANHNPAIIDFLATVGFAMGMKPDKCKKNIGIDGKEQKPKKKRKVPKMQNAADGTVPNKQNTDDDTAENSTVKEPLEGEAQAKVTQITPQTRKRKSNNSSIIIEDQLTRAKENRLIRYVPLAATEQKKLCSQFFFTYRENTALNSKARNFRSEWGMPLRSIKIAGDGNCYYRALSVRVTGSEMNHEGLRKAIMCFGETRKVEDPLIAQLYEVTEITPSKRKTAATGHQDTDHYARFPLDFVLAAKCLQVNIIVYNDDHEWEVYRPDATSCRPLVEVPQEEIPSIALEYNCDHITLVNTIG